MTGRLRLGTSRDRASYMMPRLLCAFASRYPGISVEVFTESSKRLKEALLSGRVDMVLLPAGWKEPELRAQTIYTEELVLAAKAGTIPESARLEKSIIRLKALNGMPFFLLFQEHASRIFCDAFFKRHRIHPKVKMEFASNITCYRMAAAGMGITIIPFLTTQMSTVENVELFSLGEKPETWDVQIFYRRGAYIGQPELELIEIAKDLFINETLG